MAGPTEGPPDDETECWQRSAQPLTVQRFHQLTTEKALVSDAASLALQKQEYPCA